MIKRKTYLPLAAVAAVALATAGCGGGGGSGPATDGMDMMEPMPEPMPAPEPDPQAQADAVELVARWNLQDDDGNNISGFWRRSTNDSGNQEHLSHSYRDGSSATPVVSYDANGPQFNVGLLHHGTQGLLNTGTHLGARATRYVTTNDIGEDPEGVTTSREVMADHGLGAEWHAEELTKVYENGGTLEVGIVTDVQSTDGAADQWETSTDVPHNIVLDGAPSIPADRDAVFVWILNGETIDGSLGGDKGTFACTSGEYCAFLDERAEGDYYAFSPGITFTPDGGAETPVSRRIPGPTTAADYLALGYWLYVPEDVMAAEDYDFGVFASGGDPFEVTNLAGLTGSATYAGIVLGAYYVDDSSGSPTSGLYDGSVTLNAEFGNGTETGTVTGTVSIEWLEELQSSLPSTVTLTSDNWKGNTKAYGHNYTYDMYETVRGENNIFDTEYSPDWVTDPAPWRGGHVLGFTQADVGGTYWDGDWQGAFFGNDPNDPSARPTSIAGTFHVSDHETAGLTGSFGAHKQDDRQ